MFMVAAAILVYACALLMEVQRKIKRLPRIAVVARDGNGRLLRERL
jgi:hypothetical protein